jgi:excisionase family DNA binding protein
MHYWLAEVAGMAQMALTIRRIVITGIKARISVAEIALRLSMGRPSVYRMLEDGVMPGIRLRHRWIITRRSYESWEQTCGLKATAKLCP